MCFPKALVLSGLIFLSGYLAGQTPKPSGEVVSTVNAESRLVVVDAIVTDKKGEYVRDLSPSDFHIIEDNKEQTIKSVSRESSAGAVASAPEHMVLFFGQIPVNDQAYARKAALKFIELNAGPTRQIAILNYQGSGGIKVIQTFTSDKQKLEQAISGNEATGNHALGVGSDNGLSGVSIGSAGSGEGGFTMRSLMHSVMALSDQLATLPGRKAIVVLTPTVNYTQQARTSPTASGAKPFPSMGGTQMGVPLPPPPTVVYYLEPEELAGAIETCNKANVVLYMVDVQSSHSSEQNQFAPFAAGTGGFAISNSSETFTALSRISRDQSERYVLTYAPPKTEKNSCHKIRVKTDRPGTVVRARSEYCNVDPRDPLANMQVSQDLEAQMAGPAPGTISVRMRPAYFYTGPNIARVDVAAEVSTDRIEFVKKDGRYHATLNVLGIAHQKDGSAGPRFSGTIALDLENEKAVEEFKQRPYYYESQFTAPAGSYILKLAFSSDRDTFGKAETPLVVEPWNGTHIAMSTVALAKESRKLAASGGDAWLGVGRVRLISRDLQFIPASRSTFKKPDPTMAYVEVYDPNLAKTDPPKIRIQMVVLDRASGDIKVDSGLLDMSSRVVPSSTVVPIGLRVPTESLPPGKYLLVLKASDTAGGVTGVRKAEFEIE